MWNDEVSPPIREGGTIDSNAWVTEVPQFVHYRPGSSQRADWAREPFRPGPYSATVPTVSFCAPQATTRSRGNIHVELVDLQELPDGFDCLGGVAPDQAWQAETSRVMRLYRDGRLVGTAHTSSADFLVPPNAATFRLSYADHTAAALPVSTRTSTTWTFRSAPDGLAGVRIPLLLVSYHLPLGLNDRADGQSAVFTAARVAGARARVVRMRVWVSVNNGHSWQSAPVRALGDGRFAVTLPPVAAGEAVSIRVQAADAGGRDRPDHHDRLSRLTGGGRAWRLLSQVRPPAGRLNTGPSSAISTRICGPDRLGGPGRRSPAAVLNWRPGRHGKAALGPGLGGGPGGEQPRLVPAFRRSLTPVDGEDRLRRARPPSVTVMVSSEGS